MKFFGEYVVFFSDVWALGASMHLMTRGKLVTSGQVGIPGKRAFCGKRAF